MALEPDWQDYSLWLTERFAVALEVEPLGYIHILNTIVR